MLSVNRRYPDGPISQTWFSLFLYHSSASVTVMVILKEISSPYLFTKLPPYFMQPTILNEFYNDRVENVASWCPSRCCLYRSKDTDFDNTNSLQTLLWVEANDYLEQVSGYGLSVRAWSKQQLPWASVT